jgi:hypothetical protein
LNLLNEYETFLEKSKEFKRTLESFERVKEENR